MDAPPSDNNAYRFPVSVKGVVIRDGAVILVRNSRDEWELPGGKLELCETPAECLAREIEEELGLDVQPREIIDSWVYSITADVHVLVVAYGCAEPSRGNTVLSDEHTEMRWVPLEDVGGLNMPIGYKRAIESWSAQIGVGG